MSTEATHLLELVEVEPSGAAGSVLRDMAYDYAFEALFPTPAVTGIYVGAGTRSTRYVGIRSDAQLYVGAGVLFP